jgi:hypothetical protein
MVDKHGIPIIPKEVEVEQLLARARKEHLEATFGRDPEAWCKKEREEKCANS